MPSLNARAISLLLAFCVTSVTTAFLWVITEAYVEFLVAVFSLCFASSFLLFYLSLEFIVLREINKVYSVMEKLKKKDFRISRKAISSKISAIKNLNYQIYSYASQKQQEIEHLRQLESYRREFLADVSHELKTPIFAAQGFIHTLLDGAIDDQEVKDVFLQKAARSLDSLNRLIGDLLTVSQMEAGFIKMEYDNFDIHFLTLQVFERLEDNAKNKKIKLEVLQETSDKFYVYADIQRIMQVMINLVSNAIKYGVEGGVVKVSFEESNDLINIKVADNGLGIPEEHLERIFERFYRVEKSRSKERGGSGLGLAIVKHILQAHNSQIVVNSQVKKGTVFSFKLPKATEFPDKETQMRKILHELE